MCLYEAAITQFQDLALCIHKGLCNPTHLSDDVRLALSVRWLGPACIGLYVCVCVCLFNVANKMSGIVVWVIREK